MVFLSLASAASAQVKVSWEENFCLPAKDYQGCIRFHRQKKDQALTGDSQSFKKVTEDLAIGAGPQISEGANYKSPAPLSSGGKIAVRRWRRADHDIVVFEPAIIRGPEGLDPDRYLGWTYSIYYFLPGFHSRLTVIKSPEDPTVSIQRYGPMVWSVTGDCIDGTADWRGDRQPWRSVHRHHDQSSLEARAVLEEFCLQSQTNTQKKAAQ